MPTARTEAAAAVVNDVIYAIGGMVPGSSPTVELATTEALSTPPVNTFAPGGAFLGNGGGSNSLPTVQWQSTNPSAAGVDGGGNAHDQRTRTDDDRRVGVERDVVHDIELVRRADSGRHGASVPGSSQQHDDPGDRPVGGDLHLFRLGQRQHRRSTAGDVQPLVRLDVPLRPDDGDVLGVRHERQHRNRHLHDHGAGHDSAVHERAERQSTAAGDEPRRCDRHLYRDRQ
jgi:hypothetical protein